jgi:hypothetical protein
MLLQVITAEGEKTASQALKSASEIICGSPAAMQLRYLQVFPVLYQIIRGRQFRKIAVN